MSINFGCCSIDIVDLTSRLCNGIAPHICYVRKLRKNNRHLDAALESLIALEQDKTRQVMTEEAHHPRRMLETVRDWLSRVEVMRREVQTLTIEAELIMKNSHGGFCLKYCLFRYKLGKKVAEKIIEVTSLMEEGQEYKVVTGEQLGSVVKRSSIEPVGLESTFFDVWSYIKKEQGGMIGIYGMGGVGKTTLLNQIHDKFCSDFEFVIWVVVSSNSTTVKVQDSIAKNMGFDHEDTWKNKSQEEKAERIFGVLGGKRFLLLLDDIWKRIDLAQVGVPFPNRHNKSKVVFTTRSEDVSGRMEAEVQYKVQCLGPEKAWELFQKKVGEATLNSDPEICEKAKIVVKECNGLPLALITIGRAMARKKSPQEWDRAALVLKKNAAKFSDMEDEVFPLLMFSYDSLQSDTYRSCFLYCSLFPEDYLISKQRLIEYWIGEGILDDINEGYDIIGTLIRACLLEEDSCDSDKKLIDNVPDVSGSVKMHDVIRDMALWIACECGKVEDKCSVQALDKKKTKMFIVQARSSLKEAPEIEKWKGVERMSLMHNEIRELTEAPLCPNLLTLFLYKNGLKMITSGFFQYMPNIRVLDLSENIFLKELPVEFSKLASLQYLNLSMTSISVLPIEYKNLVELKYLNLEYTDELDTIPQGLLSSFKRLRVLKMYRCRYSFHSFELETFMKEVEGLKELNHLSLSTRTASGLSRALRSPKVLSCTKLLSIIHVYDLKYQDMSFLQSMRCLHQLIFLNCEDLEDLKVERAEEGMPNSEIIGSHLLRFHSLRSVNIDGCNKLKDVTWLIFAPNLEILTINECYGMKEVICGGKWGEASSAEEAGYLNLFARLKELILLVLPLLKSIYPNVLPFPCLKSIRVVDCPNLKKLPLNSDSAKGCVVGISGSEKWRNELVWEDEATQNAYHRNLKSEDDGHLFWKS